MGNFIGKILETIPQFFKCSDGTYSTHNGRGACNFHGGLANSKPIKLRRRCRTIPTQTPTRQGDLFRKETQGDLFRIDDEVKIGDFYKHKTRNEYAQIRDLHKNIELCVFTTVSMISKRKSGTFEIIEHSPCNTIIISKNKILENWTKIDSSLVPQPTQKLIKEATAKPKITDNELIELALKIKADTHLLEGLNYFLEKKYNVKQAAKFKLIDRVRTFVSGEYIGKTGAGALIQKYVLKNEFASQFPELKQLSDATLTNDQKHIIGQGGFLLENFDPYKPIINKKPTPSVSKVEYVPLHWIGTDARFQNRGTAFSQRSVDNIINAVKDGTFRWSNLDPVILWKPDKERDPNTVSMYYILSGHSRFQAFKRLYEAGAMAQGQGFGMIPAKIEKGISFEQARQIALNSNTLSTKETDIERATYYRNA